MPIQSDGDDESPLRVITLGEYGRIVRSVRAGLDYPPLLTIYEQRFIEEVARSIAKYGGFPKFRASDKQIRILDEIWSKVYPDGQS